MTQKLIERIGRCGVVPVVVVETPGQGVELARALLRGGIDVIEVTLRTAGAIDALAAIAAEVPDILPIAGTVVTRRQVAEVHRAGTRVLISPGFTEAVSDAVRAEGLAWLPGVASASDVMRATAAGWDVLKFFPAEQAGGLPMLKALSGPFGQVRFCPTGGIGLSNAPDYLAQPFVVAIGGSWLAPAKAIADGDFGRIEQLAREARSLAERVRGETPA